MTNLPTPGFNLPYGIASSDPHIVGGDECVVECPECGEDRSVEAGEAVCHPCEFIIDEDAVRDQIER